MENRSNKEKINKKGSIKSLMKSRSLSESVCNIDDIKPEDLHNSLHQIKKDPTEPFKFLSHVLDDVDIEGGDDPSGLKKPTDIDLQLTSLVKRVEMNKYLLEKTNQRVKDINFIVEKNKIFASRDLDYDKASLSKIGADYVFKEDLTIEHPEIDEVQRTMKDTLHMLECIKKVASEDTASDDLSSEFFEQMEFKSVPSNSIKVQLQSSSKKNT